MKHLICILICLCTLQGVSQPQESPDIRLGGLIYFPESDTIIIDIWSDGRTIGRKVITKKHYTLSLVEGAPHYTIRFTSGRRVKYLHLFCDYMHHEDIKADLDFRTSKSVRISKARRKAKNYTFEIYGDGSGRTEFVPIYNTELMRR